MHAQSFTSCKLCQAMELQALLLHLYVGSSAGLQHALSGHSPQATGSVRDGTELLARARPKPRIYKCTELITLLNLRRSTSSALPCTVV